MCSALGVGVGMMGVSTLMKGMAAKQQGEAAKRSENMTADEAERAASDAVERGRLKDLQVAMRGSRVVAAQRVAVSGGGADVNVGAPQAVGESTEAVNEVDRRTVTYNATMEAYGLRSQARAHRQRGENAAAEGEAAMWGTFLSGAGQIGGAAGRLATDVEMPTGPDADEVRRLEN